MKIQTLKKVGLAVVLLSLVAVASPVSAQNLNFQPGDGPPEGIRSFAGFLGVFDTMISWLFIVLMALSVIFIILAAFSYLTAGGDEEKVKGAHKKIVWAIVAIAVAFLAQGVAYVIAELLGQQTNN